MKVIFIIIVFILILIFLVLLTRERFMDLSEKKIKGSASSDIINNINDLNIYIGDETGDKYLHSGVPYKLACQQAGKLRTNKPITTLEISTFLNISNNSCILEKPNNCNKKSAQTVNPVILHYGNMDGTDDITEESSHEINRIQNTGKWLFEKTKKNSDSLIYYGEEIFIRNMSKTGGYLCICDSDIGELKDYSDGTLPSTLSENYVKCGNIMSVYSYSNFKTALDNGRWYLIPKFHAKILGTINYGLNNKQCNSLTESNSTPPFNNKFRLQIYTESMESKDYFMDQKKIMYYIVEDGILKAESAEEAAKSAATAATATATLLAAEKSAAAAKSAVAEVAAAEAVVKAAEEAVVTAAAEAATAKLAATAAAATNDIIENGYWSIKDNKLFWHYKNKIVDSSNISFNTANTAPLLQRATKKNPPGLFLKKYSPENIYYYMYYEETIGDPSSINCLIKEPQTDLYAHRWSTKPEDVCGRQKYYGFILNAVGSLTNTDYLFYKDDTSYFDTLLNEKIPVELGKNFNYLSVKYKSYKPTDDTIKNVKFNKNIGDLFYIVNSKKIQGKYVYLNNCDTSFSELKCYTGKSFNDTIKKNKVIGSLPKNLNLNKTEEEKYYTWTLIPNKYNIDVKDTLYVNNEIKIGNISITGDTLRHIKSIPYVFKDEICLQNSKGGKSCIKREHIEMIRGERSLNLNSFISLYPYTLYSKPNYQGRELKIGFDYLYKKNLPFIKNVDGTYNPDDDGKWKSLKIEGPYSIIIYDSPNHGSVSNAKCSEIGVKHKAKERVEGSNKNDAATDEESNVGKYVDEAQSKFLCNSNPDCMWVGKTDPDSSNMNKCKPKSVNSNRMVVKAPGIASISWPDGIRSVDFPYTKQNADTGEFDNVNVNPIKKKCMTGFDNGKPKFYPGKGDEGSSVPMNVFSAKDCNNTDSQRFYLVNQNENVDLDNYPEIYNGNKHLHFHRHLLSEKHDNNGNVTNPSYE